jgi:predicted enzyme related to lactoylglutathione lyase
MAKVLGIGGIFFKSPNPKKLYEWYTRWLGIEMDGEWGKAFFSSTMPTKGYTVWSAFDDKSTYFEPSENKFMFNLIVDNLEEALKQVKEGGAELVGKIEEIEYGLFSWFIDPDGNKVELWEPK